MNKETIFWALAVVIVVIALAFIESVERNKNETNTELQSEFNETMKCMKWNGTLTSKEYIKNETGMHLTYNDTRTIVFSRAKIEYFDMSSDLTSMAIQENRENCTHASFDTTLYEYSLNDIDFDVYVTIHYDEDVRYALSHSRIDVAEFKSDMCLEYIKIYKKKDDEK